MSVDDLFRRYYPSLHRYLVRLTGDVDAAHDMAQESFVRLLDQSIPEDEAKPWLFTVATNLVRDAARRTSRRERLLESAPIETVSGASPDSIVERNERIALVRAALGRLSERDRVLLLMREEGFSYAEIAEAIGVASSSVGTLLARALKRFTEAYRIQGVGDDSPE